MSSASARRCGRRQDRLAGDFGGDAEARLIWQESRFRPEAVSHAGAQGVAQFMPGTARMRGLADPFEPREAIAKSAELLQIPAHRGQSFRRIADSNPVIADSF